ncbi:transcriptional regulator, LytR family protein, partial [Mycobacterium tuberculosis]
RPRPGLAPGALARPPRPPAFLSSVLRALPASGPFPPLARLAPLLAVARPAVVLSAGWAAALFRRLGALAGGPVAF